MKTQDKSVKKIGRPVVLASGKTFGFHLTYDDVEALDLMCAQNGMNRSEAIRWLIRQAT
jgi:hypothetical protein